MKKERGVTLIAVIIMIIVISIIATVSIISSRSIFGEAKESVLKQNRVAVESAVSKYSAKAMTEGVYTPANIEFPGRKNPSFDYKTVDATGNEITESKNVGEDWYLLLEESMEQMGISYADENYLVNYKLNIVIPLSEADDIFRLVEYHENKI